MHTCRLRLPNAFQYFFMDNETDQDLLTFKSLQKVFDELHILGSYKSISHLSTPHTQDRGYSHHLPRQTDTM